jgi:hypothetical protein
MGFYELNKKQRLQLIGKINSDIFDDIHKQKKPVSSLISQCLVLK